MKVKLSKEQFKKVKKLVQSTCANYSSNECMLKRDYWDGLVQGCPQMQCSTGLCKYFKECVLPVDKQLEMEILGKGYTKKCKKCKKTFMTKGRTKEYCEFCAKIVKRDKTRERVRKLREQEKQNV